MPLFTHQLHLSTIYLIRNSFRSGLTYKDPVCEIQGSIGINRMTWRVNSCSVFMRLSHAIHICIKRNEAPNIDSFHWGKKGPCNQSSTFLFCGFCVPHVRYENIQFSTTQKTPNKTKQKNSLKLLNFAFFPFLHLKSIDFCSPQFGIVQRWRRLWDSVVFQFTHSR